MIVTIDKPTLKYTVESAKSTIPNANIIFVKGKGIIGDLRNKGLSQVKTDVCCFADDDCVLNKNWFNKCYSTLQHSSNIIVACGKAQTGTEISDTLGCLLLKTKEFKALGGWTHFDSYIFNKYGDHVIIVNDAICQHLVQRGLRKYLFHWFLHGVQTEVKVGFYSNPKETFKQCYGYLRHKRPEGFITCSLMLIKTFFSLPFIAEEKGWGKHW